jgi:hypothetical protein
VLEHRVTTKELSARIDANRSLTIPIGERIDVGPRLTNGQVRIYWSGSNEGLGGLSVMENDLESRTGPA